MTPDRCPECGSEYADPNRDVCLECEDYKGGEAGSADDERHSSGCVCADCTVPDEDAPRVQAALDAEREMGERVRRRDAERAACKDITTLGLEQLVQQGKTLELALAATMIVRAQENRERAERHDAVRDECAAECVSGNRPFVCNGVSGHEGLHSHAPHSSECTHFPPLSLVDLSDPMAVFKTWRHDAALTERVRAVTPVDAMPYLLANPLVPGAK